MRDDSGSGEYSLGEATAGAGCPGQASPHGQTPGKASGDPTTQGGLPVWPVAANQTKVPTQFWRPTRGLGTGGAGQGGGPTPRRAGSVASGLLPRGRGQELGGSSGSRNPLPACIV